MPDVDDGEEQRARAAFAALNDIAVGALKIHVLPHHANTASCAWHRDFMVALDAHAAKVGDMSKAEIIIPSMDLLVPHYPSFLWECRRWPGGHGRFAEERCQRMGEMWVRIIPEMRARMSAAQRLLVFDLESNISQCSAFAHEQKLQLGGDPRIVHISICLDASSYRPGKDISFPACLPAAFGDAAVRAVPPARREIFFSFRGSGRRMPLREQILAMHNGTDRVCLDAHPHRSQLQAASEAATGVRVPPQSDDEYVALHARSRFSLCPRGDAVYSFRFVEALSCGAIPVLYGDGWVLPFSELVDYHDFAVVIAEDDVASTPKVLAAIGPAQLEAMQRSGRATFERLIGSVPAQLDAVLDILRARRQEDSSSRPSSRDHAGDAITTRHQVCGSALALEGIARRAQWGAVAATAAPTRPHAAPSSQLGGRCRLPSLSSSISNSSGSISNSSSSSSGSSSYSRRGGSRSGVEISAWRSSRGSWP